MKKNIPTIIAAIACVLVVICMFRISNLNEQIQNMTRSLSSGISNLQSSYYNLPNNIRSTLEEQASLLADETWQYGEPDFDEKTVALTCSVTPKEYKPDTTQAKIVCNGSEYPMALKNGAYTVTIPISLLEEMQASRVMFVEGDTIRTQALNWTIDPRFDILLDVTGDFDGRGELGNKGNSLVWHRSGGVNVNVNSTGDYPDKVMSVDFVAYIDGKETNRTNIPSTDAWPVEQDAADRAAVAPAVSAYAENMQFSLPVDQEYVLSFGSTIDLYAEVVDEYGLRYSVLLDHQKIGVDGRPADD